MQGNKKRNAPIFSEARIIGVIVAVGAVVVWRTLGHPQAIAVAQTSPMGLSASYQTEGNYLQTARASIEEGRRRMRWDTNLYARPSRGRFKRFYQMKATAYIPQNKGIEGGRWTVTERDGQAVHGVAVDPSLIPLGSRLWIPGYGHAVADDIGSAIKGHHVDLRMQSEENMHEWGVRQVQVYVLDEPETD
jgi:3D (Asp-Asp-Asp) domain-containing protein